MQMTTIYDDTKRQRYDNNGYKADDANRYCKGDGLPLTGNGFNGGLSVHGSPFLP